MKNDKNQKMKNKEMGPRTNDDQLGENASGLDSQDEVYKKEHHKKVK